MDTHTTIVRTGGKNIFRSRVFAVAFVIANLFFVQHAFTQVANQNGVNIPGTVGSYVSINDNALLNPTRITVEAWVNLSAWGASGSCVIAKGTGSGGEVWSLDIDQPSSNVRFYGYISGTAYVATSGSLPSKNAWHHLVGTFDGTNFRVYVDGVLGNISTNVTGAPKNLGTNTHIVSIGARQSGSTTYDFTVTGVIDEVRIWNFAKTLAQIQTDMFREIDPASANLISYYKFNGTSNQYNDLTTNGFNGAAVGSTSIVTSTAPIPFYSIATSAWNVTTTWASGQGVPPSVNYSDVEIEHSVSLDANKTVRDLTIDASGTLSMLTRTLTVSSIDMTGGSITFTSGTGISLGGDVNTNANATSATISAPISLGATRTITVADGAASTDMNITGIVSGSTLGIIKDGAGLLNLGAANTYTGSTTIANGTLQLSIANAIKSGASGSRSDIILSGGIFSTGTGVNDGTTASPMGTLQLLTNNSSIALGSSPHTIAFAASNAISWTALKTITIIGWLGNYSTGASSAGKIFVGANSSGLTAGQLGQILFFDGSNYFPARILSTGEVVPFVLITGSISGSPFCVGTTNIIVPFTYTGASFPAGTTTFTAQLSNDPSFTSPIILQSVASNATGSQSISVTIPSGTPAGNNYQIRVVSDNPAVNGTPSAVITVNALPLASVSAQSNVQCFGGTDGSITVLASGGTAPYKYAASTDGVTFNWITPVPPSTNPYTIGGLIANQPYRIKVMDANGCISK